MSAEPVLITGAGCITAAGRNLPETMASLFAGTRSPAAPTRFRTDHPIAYPVFEIPDTWIAEQIPDASPHRRCADLGWIASREALNMAALDESGLPSARAGLCLGTVVGAALEDEDFYTSFHAGGCPDVTPAERFLQANPAFMLHKRLGITGPYMTVTTACTSGAAAIAQAASWIRAGVCDLVIAGGVEKLSRLSYDGFVSLMIADAEPCRPFDRDRKGLNLGEGAGVLILESETSARNRGAPVLGRLLGEGNTCDAYHLSRPRPDGDGLRRAVQEALKQAGLGPPDIAFINAHGTGTLDNDLMEGKLFASMFPHTPFHSTKGCAGHTLGAAGGIEAVLTLGCLREGRLPASAGFTHPDPDVGATPVTDVTPVRGSVALSTSVAYGGNNTALIFARGPADE